jgi:hypothetical protein
MTATTSKLGADMLTDEQIDAIAQPFLHLGDGDAEHDSIDWRGFARALLARQPAAIGKEAVSVGAHLWMPSEIANPTSAPPDFGDRKAYAFKAPNAGEHDPWFVVLPNMAALKLGYHADDEIDRQHAEFIAAAINRAIAAPLANEASKPVAPVGWRLNVGQSDERIWLTVTTPHGATASLSCADRNGSGRTIQGQVLMALKEALEAPTAPSVEQDERGAVIATVRTDPPITGVTTGPWTRLFVADVEIDRSGDPTELVKKAEQINHSYAHQSRAASTSANVAQGAELVHLDDWWVDLFAKEMKAKLENARAKGRGGWQDCDPADLSRMLGEHVEKGDPRDVANFCMFLWALRSPICADPPAQTALADAQKWEIAERVHAQCERLKPHATFRSAASQAINDTLDALTAAQSASGDK